MRYKKSELTEYAKNYCCYASKILTDAMCISEELSKHPISKEIIRNDNEELKLEVAKRFAKYVKDEIEIDLENGNVQDATNIINELLACCEENNWFKSDD